MSGVSGPKVGVSGGCYITSMVSSWRMCTSWELLPSEDRHFFYIFLTKMKHVNNVPKIYCSGYAIGILHIFMEL